MSQNHQPVTLTVVLPCYNEAVLLHETHRELGAAMFAMVMRKEISTDSKMLFVDDGSIDDTWAVVQALSDKDPRVSGLRLSRNCGHQQAILTGMLAATGDAVVTIDADLQDDPKLIAKMVRRFRNGKEIVFGVREDRSVDTFSKRWSAAIYYRVLRQLGVKLVPGHADFRLVGRRAIEALRSHPEVNVFLRGLIGNIGFETTCVRYELRARKQGKSKYTLRKMIALSIDGITSFSAVPLRMIALMGLTIFLISLGLVAYSLIVRLALDQAVPGWASITVPLYALGGLQLLALGVVGEYVSKIFVETKRRPHAIIAERIDRSRDLHRVSFERKETA